MLQTFPKSLKQAAPGLRVPVPLAKCPQARLYQHLDLVSSLASLGTSQPSTNNSHLQTTLWLMLGGPGQNTGSGDIGLKLAGGPRASIPSGQFQTT